MLLVRRVFWPGILGLVGTIAPVSYLVIFLATLDSCAAIGDPSGGSLICLFLLLPSIMLVVGVYAALSIVFFVRQTLVWAGIVSFMNGFLFIYLFPNYYYSLSSYYGPPAPTSTWILFALEAIPPAIGLVGGVWGFFQKDAMGNSPHNVRWFVPHLVILAALVSLLGVLSALDGLFLSVFGLVWIIGPVLVLVCAVLLQKGIWRLRGLGTLMIVGSAPSLILSLLIEINGVWWYLPSYVPGAIGSLASLLTLVAGIRFMITKPIVQMTTNIL